MQNANTISMPDKMSKRSKIIEDIIDEARGWLLDSVRGLVPRYEDAEDIVQDVFYQFVGGFDQIRSLESSYAWLSRTARNRVTDFYRRRGRTIEGTLRSASPIEGENARLLEEIIPDNEATPERRLELHELEQRIEAAIESLPEPQREVFVWHEIEELSFKEIADLTGESVNTLLSRKRYAVLALRKQLIDIYA